jgi:hypothetical protein
MRDQRINVLLPDPDERSTNSISSHRHRRTREPSVELDTTPQPDRYRPGALRFGNLAIRHVE